MRNLTIVFGILVELFSHGFLFADAEVDRQNSVSEKAERLPKFSFKMTEVRPGKDRKDGTWTVGHVSIYKGEKDSSEKAHQVLNMAMDTPEVWFAQFGVRRPDLNCDGWAGIEISQHEGSKSGRSHIWLYEPKTEKFYTNALTKAFAEMAHANFRIDVQQKRLKVQQFEGTQIFESIYDIKTNQFQFLSKSLVED